MGTRPGELDAIVDVGGLRVGHQQRLDARWASGTTVVLAPDGATAAVDVRGGGPGTRETDVLEPSHLVQQVQAVVLTGGSAYGLAAADGVMRWLGERGHGVRVGADPSHVVPVVPGAVIFDLPMSDWGNRPDAEFGYRACENASGSEIRQGNVGAGTGAVVGTVKGGIGTASAVLDDGTTVGALMVVNASGSAIDPDTGLPWIPTPGLRAPDPAEVEAARRLAGKRPGRHGPIDRPLNTTIGVVATDLRLAKPECQRLAVAAQDGLARAIRPAHALVDGDTVFALATGTGAALPAPGEPGWSTRLDAVCAVAAEVAAQAIVRGVLAADPVDEVTSYTRLYPSVRE
ncbi:P1 family peptidase [Saccharopolyspora phatthalungensis]|uniref:L-aminopeptidase/D-esterase-like protein n=1 Tax=Saccharopolyspora phatthalungensis TaxID=664693 RepID=A0A840Q3D0_9PSEU|nr:P1 family peptidase [Saccharopolyspora phatthalungensis]MBB5153248.1 L-aminopeptidase/D-esterase-like protein [Saccharopolyspora phatthalungensis]